MSEEGGGGKTAGAVGAVGVGLLALLARVGDDCGRAGMRVGSLGDDAARIGAHGDDLGRFGVRGGGLGDDATRLGAAPGFADELARVHPVAPARLGEGPLANVVDDVAPAGKGASIEEAMADTGVDVVFQVTDFTYEGDDEPLPVPSLPLEFEPWGVPKMVVFDERHALDLGSRKIPLVPAFTAPRKELIGIVANTDASDERVMAGTTSFSIPEVMSLCIAGGGPCVLLTCAPDAEATCMTTAATVFARASKDFKYRAGEKAHRNSARFAWGLLSARADAAPTKLGITRFDSQSARLVRSTLRPATVRELGPSASASASAAPPRSAPAKKQAP